MQCASACSLENFNALTSTKRQGEASGKAVMRFLQVEDTLVNEALIAEVEERENRATAKIASKTVCSVSRSCPDLGCMHLHPGNC